MTTNSDDKNVRYKMDCYTLHTFLLVIILFFVIAIICYHYAKHWSKLKYIYIYICCCTKRNENGE